LEDVAKAWMLRERVLGTNWIEVYVVEGRTWGGGARSEATSKGRVVRVI